MLGEIADVQFARAGQVGRCIGFSRPAINFAIVDLPLPFGPEGSASLASESIRSRYSRERFSGAYRPEIPI